MARWHLFKITISLTMIITALCTKRIVPSIRCSSAASTIIGCSPKKLKFINSQRINHLIREQQHRHLSSSSSSSTGTSTNTIISSSNKRLSKRQKAKQKLSQQQQQQHDNENFKPIPRWPAVVSVLIVPVMFAAWGASDWFFGNKIKGYDEALRKEFIAATANHQKDNNNNNNNDDNYVDNDNDDYLTVLEKKPTLFHCVIRRDTGFIHCLSGVQLLDVVEVLEEGVGPDRQYNLCRLPAKESSSSSEEESESESPPSLSTDTYGWFPVRWLQKLDHYESMVQEQARNIASSTAN